MSASLPLGLLFLALSCSVASPADHIPAFEVPGPVAPAGRIDRIVFDRLATLDIQPVLCSDAVFIRRVFVDVLGVLPTANEARAFLQDPDAKHKRRKLIDRVLEREEFADYWAMRWSDVLRIKAEFPVNLWPNAAQAYHRWVRAAVAANRPYDQFVRELLTSSGSNFRVGPVNFYRAVQQRTPEGIAGAVAQTFLGMRVESWSTQRVDHLAAFFSQIGYKPTGEWKEEHVFWDPLGSSALGGSQAPGRADVAAIGQSTHPSAEATLPPPPRTPPQTATFPDGSQIPWRSDRDPREVFADWLVAPRNPWFARCAVNRVWAWLLGRGIIHEPDDIRDDNPPSHPELLDALQREFVANRYDVRRLIRLILNSQTYQLSSVPRWQTREAEALFASYPLRRLDAEVLIDVINQVTGASDLYTSPIPEPFTYIPEGKPAVAIADGSITSPFLALFGRPARATGLSNERNNKPVPAQSLHLLNSAHIQRKLENGPRIKALLDSGKKPPELVEELYLTILSRRPTDGERAVLEAYGQTQAPKAGRARDGKAPAPGPPVIVKTREDWVDIAWSLINSDEFLFRH